MVFFCAHLKPAHPEGATRSTPAYDLKRYTDEEVDFFLQVMDSLPQRSDAYFTLDEWTPFWSRTQGPHAPTPRASIPGQAQLPPLGGPHRSNRRPPRRTGPARRSRSSPRANPWTYIRPPLWQHSRSLRTYPRAHSTPPPWRWDPSPRGTGHGRFMHGPRRPPSAALPDSSSQRQPCS